MNDMDLKIVIGKKIKDLRNEKGINQIEAAKLLNIDKSTIAKYETGAAMPSTHMIVALAQFFDVTTDYLLGMED